MPGGAPWRRDQLRRDQIHAAVTALIEVGVPAADIASLADLVVPENFKQILLRRYEMSAGAENVFNRDVARSLIEIAYQWVKVDEPTADELRRLAGKLPTPAPGLTRKNKGALRQPKLRSPLQSPSCVTCQFDRRTSRRSRSMSTCF